MKLRMVRYGSILTFALATIAAGPLGCASTEKGPTKEDQKLSSKVEDALKHDPVCKYKGVNVSSASGTVQLSGFTASQTEKQRAEQVAKKVNGVNQVDNKIVVQQESARF